MVMSKMNGSLEFVPSEWRVLGETQKIINIPVLILADLLCILVIIMSEKYFIPRLLCGRSVVPLSEKDSSKAGEK
jgi:hypothetical protein